MWPTEIRTGDLPANVAGRSGFTYVAALRALSLTCPTTWGHCGTQIHLTAECKKSVNIEFSFDIKELAFPAAMPCSAMIVSDLGKDDDSGHEKIQCSRMRHPVYIF